MKRVGDALGDGASDFECVQRVAQLRVWKREDEPTKSEPYLRLHTFVEVATAVCLL